jgi:hypothetical protein
LLPFSCPFNYDPIGCYLGAVVIEEAGSEIKG